VQFSQWSVQHQDWRSGGGALHIPVKIYKTIVENDRVFIEAE